MSRGREGFGGHLSRGALDGSFFEQTFYNSALDLAPGFGALGSVPTAAVIDSDGDGVADDEDAFPNDPNESADADGDGVGNNADAFDHSNTEPNVSVRSCTVPVANRLLSNGATFNDLLAAAATGARNHSAYVGAVTQLADDWKKAGLINGSHKGAITSCAARSK